MPGKSAKLKTNFGILARTIIYIYVIQLEKYFCLIFFCACMSLVQRGGAHNSRPCARVCGQACLPVSVWAVVFGLGVGYKTYFSILKTPSISMLPLPSPLSPPRLGLSTEIFKVFWNTFHSPKLCCFITLTLKMLLKTT